MCYILSLTLKCSKTLRSFFSNFLCIKISCVCSKLKTETRSNKQWSNLTINLGSIAATTSLVVSQSSRLDDGIFTSSEEVLDDQMHSPNSGDAVPHQQQNSKSSGSLDGDGDRGSIISWGDEIRPASAQANPVSRMCTGAFSRALVRLSGDVSSRSSAASTSSTDSSELIRRQSSPVFRLSTS